MKKAFIKLLFTIGAITFYGYIMRFNYAKPVKVVNIAGDVVTVSDDGLLFDFIGDGFKVGDTLQAVFNDNGTEYTRNDDSIIKVIPQ